MKNLRYIFLLLSISTFAQDRLTTQTDSLLAVIGYTQNDSIKTNCYARLGAIWQTKDFQKAIRFTQEALKYAQKYNNQEQTVDIMLGLGYSYMSVGNAGASIDILQQIIPFVENKNFDLHGTALNFISQNYIKLHDYDNALKYMRAAFALGPQMIREQRPLSQQSYLGSCIDFANIFSKINHIDSALHYAAIAYKRLHSVKLEPASIFFTWNIPLIYGDAHRNAKHYDRAMQLYQEALSNAQKQRFQTAVHNIKLSVAHLFEQTKQIDSALVYAQEALVGFQQSGDYPRLSEAGMLLYTLYKRQHNAAKALQYYEIGMATRDSVQSRKKIMQVQYLTFKEENQKREAAIGTEKKQTRQRLYLLLAGLALFAIISFLLYHNNRQKQRLNQQLASQKDEIEALNEGLEQKVEQRTAELKQALNEVQTAFAKGQTVERKRVSADLHDEIGASLSTIAIFSDITKRKAQNTAPELANELDKIGKKSREMVQTMRDTIWSLNDNNQQSVWERMNLTATEMLTAKSIALQWNVPPETELPDMPFNTKRNLFLAFKEAINNIGKHAEATTVNVECLMMNDELEHKTHEDKLHLTHNPTLHIHYLSFIITDNGKGFNVQNIESQGNGLKNFEKRMTEIGGTANIESEIGKGTRLIFSLPTA